jgi:hypothetical protein
MRQTIQLSPHEAGDLLFGQQHIRTQDFFLRTTGSSHTVPMRKSPHFLFASGLDETAYLDYLKTSWGFYFPQASEDDLQQRAQRFRDHIGIIKAHGTIDDAVEAYQRPDGNLVLLDGNHRASISIALGLNLPITLLDRGEALAKIVLLAQSRYGADSRGIPYQGLSLNGEMLLHGRRPDILRRFNMIRRDDLQDATVLDLGSNIGSNLFLAAEHGAKKVVGIESDPHIASVAVRLNTFFKTPTRVIEQDLSIPWAGESCDTVFALSVYAHVSNKSGLATTIRQCTKRILYFEGHSASSMDSYPEIFSMFTQIELLGYGSAGIHSREFDRPLWRCEV